MGDRRETGGQAWRVCKPFINGGIAGSIGIAIMQPMDLSETLSLQMQTVDVLFSLAARSAVLCRCCCKKYPADDYWVLSVARIGAVKTRVQVAAGYARAGQFTCCLLASPQWH